tara:strand:- start:41 stop:637 length:597 start_codon:yes stop_codon:yes gene_type:complete
MKNINLFTDTSLAVLHFLLFNNLFIDFQSGGNKRMGSACSTPIDKSQLPKGVVIDPDRLDQPAFGSVPSSKHLDKVFTRFSKNKNSLVLEELVLLMTTLRRMYTKNKPELVQQLNVPEFDDEFFKLVLFALDDDSSNTVEINEWKRWITRGASMEITKREEWATKDENNQRLDIFLRSVLDACGTSVDTTMAPSFDSW